MQDIKDVMCDQAIAFVEAIFRASVKGLSKDCEQRKEMSRVFVFGLESVISANMR
jgi:hypothetical protein